MPGVALPALALLIALPLVMQAIGQPFYTVLASRILIFALAASSLNLLIGFGGMVSFGHAAFFGTGAYTVAILMFHGVDSAWIAWPDSLSNSIFTCGPAALTWRTLANRWASPLGCVVISRS